MENVMKKVMNLRGVTYNFKGNKNKKAGFIAQEVEQVIPSIVSDNDKYKAIAETKIIAYLVGAIQEFNVEQAQEQNDAN